MTRFLVAPDKFKGTFGAGVAARAIAAGLREAGATAIELPVADGGEGTAEALLGAIGGKWLSARTEDALGREVEGRFALLADGSTAVIEVAEASGQWRLRPEELDPVAATSRGTGHLILAGLEAGAERIVLAAGGSATTDGGSGILEVLGAAGARPMITVACDVDIPWGRAPAIFGPQKGAGPEAVARLERRLDRLASAAPRDPRGISFTGCAGGIAGGLWAHLDATLAPGADLVLDAIGFDRALAAADAVVTGEGRLDRQTERGKAVAAVARRATAAGKPCHAVVGSLDLTVEEAARLRLSAVLEATDLPALRRAGLTLAG